MDRITLTCSCGTVLGSIDLAKVVLHAPAPVRKMLTGELLSSTLEARCPTCEAKHGT